MNQRVLKTLEYDKIIDQLETYASSPMGKKRCRTLQPFTRYEDIIGAQEETADALKRLYRSGFLSFNGLSDLRPCLKLLEIDAVLSAGELLEVARVLSLCAQVKDYGEIRDGSPVYDSLLSYFDRLEPLEFLHLSITGCILSADEISDDASSALRDIRREIKQTNGAIHNKLASIVNSQSNKTLLQDALITVRNGRYCVPVKAEYKNAFPGMIHDQSASGSTLFIEPMSVVQLNNRLKELDIQEKAEIEKILQRLSSQVASEASAIYDNQELLTELDFIFAKAKYAKAYRGTEPVFNEDKIIDIKQGRHPLLDPKKAVPIHIYLGEDFSMLLLTGPNTGGKTVSLKTLGLFQLMGQAGLHIPAFEGSRLAVFTEIFADIGDEQSIEMNLSTFSSHMTNLVQILKEAGPDSLVLLDELCGGTDPTEGAALAIAILDDLHTADIRTVATTHYAELKMFAMEKDRVENGCCEFDLDTLSPTYRLLIGIPGKSNAFAISRRLGLPDYIIDQARSQLDVSAIDFESMLSRLEKDKADLEKEQQNLALAKEEIESLKGSLQQKNDDLKEQRAAILREARAEAHHILDEAKEMADESIRKFNAWNRHTGQNNTRKMEAQRSGLRKKMSSLEKGMRYQSKKTRVIHDPRDFKVGDLVFVTTLSLEGTVKKAADKDGNLTVQMGFLTSTVHYKDLELKEQPKETPVKKSGSHGDKYSINKAATISPELNILGCTVDEGVARLEKYLDDAMIAGLSSVRIVHGKGTGALRRGIHEYLRRQSFIKSYKLAEFGEGDSGVTVVTLK